jgi:NitT/TauT family transport system substrate-binding protein
MRARKTLSAITAISAALLLAACGDDETGGQTTASGGSTEDAPIELQIGRAPAFTQFPLFVAEEKGFWEDGGIDATFVSIASGPEQTAAQIAGDLDIVDNVPNNLLPIIDKGVDLKAFTVAMKASQFDIIVDADYPLTAKQGDWKGVMNDLKGANVGVIARGTGAEDVARTLFEEAGVDPESNTYIATGLPSTTIAAMQNDQIDMAITLEPGIAQAVASGLAVSPFSIRKGEAPESLIWPGVVATVTSDFAAENPDALTRYVDVLETTLEFIRDPANEEEIVGLMEKTLSVPADTATVLYENNLDNYPDHVALTDDDIEQLDNAATWVHGLAKTSKKYTGADFTVRVGE